MLSKHHLMTVNLLDPGSQDLRFWLVNQTKSIWVQIPCNGRVGGLAQSGFNSDRLNVNSM